MNIALLLVVNCISDIVIDRTLCDYMIQLLVARSNLVFYYQFIHKHFVLKRTNV